MNKLPFKAGDELEAKTNFGTIRALIVAVSPETGKVFVKHSDSMAPRDIKDIVKRVNNGTFKVIKATEGL